MKSVYVSFFALLASSTLSNSADLPSKKQPIHPITAASNDFDGYASVGLGYNWKAYDGASPTGLHAHGRGSFYAPLTGVFGFQLDGVYERNAYGSQQATEHTGSVATHVFARNTTGLVGVIAQANYTTSTDGVVGEAHEHDSRYFIGGEAQYFVSPTTTLYGQAAYQNYSFKLSPSSSAISTDGYSAVGQIRQYIGHDWMVQAKLAYEYLDLGNLAEWNKSSSSWAVGGKVVYHIHDTPLSVFTEAQHRWTDVKFDGGSSKSETENRFLVGLKYSFGSKTLLERDRSGASLDPIEALAGRRKGVLDNPT